MFSNHSGLSNKNYRVDQEKPSPVKTVFGVKYA